VIGRVDFAAAVKRTGELTVLPGAGEHTFTPTVVVVQPAGVESELVSELVSGSELVLALDLCLQ